VLDALTLQQWLMAWSVVFVGSLVQGTAGFGFSLTVAPLLRALKPETIPVSVITAALLLIVLMLLRERQHLALKGAGWVLAGRVPGALFGAWLLGVLPARTLSLVIAGLVLGAVGSIAFGWSVPFNRATQALAGAASGITGTTTSIGGPPLALLYRERAGHELRSTLAAIFLVGVLINFAALGTQSQLRLADLKMGVMLMPAVVAGFLASSVVRTRIDGPRLKAAILIVSTLGALGLVAQTLL